MALRDPDVTPGWSIQVSERGMVGAILIRPAQVGEAAAQVGVEDMADMHVRWVYAAMLALWHRGIEPHCHAVEDELRANDRYDGLPSGFLTTLMADAPVNQADRYVRVILDAALRRRLALVGKTITTVASDPATEVGDALDQAKEMVGSLRVPSSAPSEEIDLPTFCDGEDSFDWLIPLLIERGDRILVVAAEAAGKSFLLRQIAVCSAFGIHPFTGRVGQAMRVVLLDFENPVSLVRRKIRPIYHKARIVAPLADPKMMGVVCKPGGIDVTLPSDASWLASQLTAAKPDLVVAGPLYKMFSADDKWEQGARTVTTLLDDLRTRLGFALVLETHAPQSFGGHRHLRPIGSSLWLRWPEFCLSFAPTDTNPNVVQLTVGKGRDERPWPKFLERGGEWPWSPCGDPNPKAKPAVPLVPPKPAREYEQEEAW